MTSKLLGNVEKGMLFVISAPAGTGKTTLAHLLTREFPCIIQSISYTSRSPRLGETDGIDYHFLTKEQFRSKIEEGEFLESVTLYDDYYGTSRKWVEEKQNKGKHVLLVIDTQGAMQLMEKVEAVFIFIRPPSFEELKERLLKRQTENQIMVEKRLEWSVKEMEASAFYDYCIVNDNLDTAYQVLRSILIAEEHRVRTLENKEKGSH